MLNFFEKMKMFDWGNYLYKLSTNLNKIDLLRKIIGLNYYRDNSVI